MNYNRRASDRDFLPIREDPATFKWIMGAVLLLVLTAFVIAGTATYRENQWKSQSFAAGQPIQPFETQAALRLSPPVTRGAQDCSEDDLVCMQVTTQQPSEVFKGIDALIPDDASKHYQVRVTVIPVQDN